MQIFKEIKIEEFEAKAMPHLNDIFRVALRLAKNRSEAENLIEEVYLQAWRTFRLYESETNCRAWLFKILFSKFNHHRQKNITFEFAKDDDALRNPDFKPAVVAATLSDEEICSSLEYISPDFREPMLLAHVEEFSYEEITEILDIPLETVKSRISRGRVLMRSEMMKLADSHKVVSNEGVFV